MALTGLRRFELLQPLDDERLLALSEALRPIHLPRQTRIVTRGERARSVYFIMEGRLKVVEYTDAGRELGLAWLSEGECFGEMALIDEQPRSADVVAVTDVRLLELPADAARTRLLSEPEVVRLAMHRLARLVRRDNRQRTLLGTSNAFQRVYAFLVSLIPEDSQPAEWVLDRSLTHEAIATMTDTTRETVSRAVAALREQRIAEKRGQALAILDIPRLMELACGKCPPEPACRS